MLKYLYVENFDLFRDTYARTHKLRDQLLSFNACLSKKTSVSIKNTTIKHLHVSIQRFPGTIATNVKTTFIIDMVHIQSRLSL